MTTTSYNRKYALCYAARIWRILSTALFVKKEWFEVHSLHFSSSGNQEKCIFS